MITGDRLSSSPVLADFLDADALPRQRLQDFEQGGVAIGDPSQGLQVQTWELRVLGRDVRVRPFPNGTYTLLFQYDNIRRIGLAWDQNMRPAVVFEADGVTRLWWYDPLLQRQAFKGLPGARDVAICLDEKRDALRDFSDILVFYLKDSVTATQQRLFMRRQRDRYDNELVAGFLPPAATALERVGMTRANRLRFLLHAKPEESGGPRRPLPPYPPGSQGNSLILQFSETFYPGSVEYANPLFEFSFYTPPLSDI